MKKFMIGLLLTVSGNLMANELNLIQLHECKFDMADVEFVPSFALTNLIGHQLGGGVIYKVQYNPGTLNSGPSNHLAVMDLLPSKTIGVSFFDYDTEDGVEYFKYSIMIDLNTPTSIENNLISFEAVLKGQEQIEGSCTISF